MIGRRLFSKRAFLSASLLAGLSFASLLFAEEVPSLARAEALREKGDDGAAVTVLDELLRKTTAPELGVLLCRAELLARHHRLHEALQDLSAARKIAPTAPEPEYTFLRIALEQGWSSSVEESLQKLKERGMDPGPLAPFQAELQLQQGKIAEAEKILTAALQQKSDDPTLMLLDAWRLLAQGREQEAGMTLAAIAEKNPGTRQDWLRLARLAIAANAPGPAATALPHLDPENQEGEQRLCFELLAAETDIISDRVEAAKTRLGNMRAAAKNRPDFLRAWGRLLLRGNDLQGAALFLETSSALERDPFLLPERRRIWEQLSPTARNYHLVKSGRLLESLGHADLADPYFALAATLADFPQGEHQRLLFLRRQGRTADWRRELCSLRNRSPEQWLYAGFVLDKTLPSGWETMAAAPLVQAEMALAKRDLKEAAEQLNQFVPGDKPPFFGAVAARGLLEMKRLQAQEKIGEAEALGRKLVSEEEDVLLPEYQATRAEILLSAARPDLALAATSKALTADPSLIIPRFIEIEALRFLNRKTEALTALKSLEALLASQNDEAGQSLKARAALLKAQLDAEK